MFGVFRIVDGPEAGRTFDLVEGQTLRFGRGPDMGVQLTDPKVSRHHCDVHMAGRQAVLRDAGSVAGTWVNGERVTEHQMMAGDVVRLGDTKLQFQWSTLDESCTRPDPDEED
jgi:pSer/pThr/pTyr-binding forkhead associated (FHA) protein